MKKWYHSRTLRLQAFTAVLAMAELQFNLLETYLGEHYNAVYFLIVLANVYLRFDTSQAIGAKSNEQNT